MDDLLVVGNGGHARACIDVIEKQKKYSIFGIIDNITSKENNNSNYPILGNDNDLPNIIKTCENLFLGFGFIKSSKKRSEYFINAKSLNYKFPVIISPSSYVSNTSVIHEGTIIMHHALINSSAKVGRNCIINSKALIEHDTFIGDNTHISTAAVVNGSAIIGEGCFIGSNSVIGEGVKVGDNSIISAGVFLQDDLPAESFYKK